MSEQYPTDQEMYDFLAPFTTLPALDALRDHALATGTPLRKLVRDAIELAGVDVMIQKMKGEGRL